MFSPVPFGDFSVAIARLYSTGRHARPTRTRMAQVLRELGALGPVTTADLTTDLMARWVASRGPHANPNTINGLLGSASAACSYALAEGWLERPPCWRRLRLRPGPTVRNAPPPYDQVAKLLDDLAAHRGDGWAQHRLCALAWTVALTGLRRNEALYLKLADLDLGDDPVIRIEPAPGRRLKTAAAARRVPLPDVLAELLRGWVGLAGPVWLFPGLRRRGPWTGGSATSRPIGALQTAARASGVPHVTWHALRHAFGTAAVGRWGVSVWVVQRVLGHTDPRTTERYLHLSDAPAIAAAVRSLRYAA